MRRHSLADVLAMDIPEREDVVAGLFSLGDAILLSAREKSGKGLLMMDACTSVASGEPFLGRAVKQGPTLYLALEEGPRTVRDRFRLRAGERPDLPISVIFLDGSENQTFRLDDPESIEGLRQQIIEYQPVLVVLDVLREAHNGRENESDDMAILLRPIRQIAHEFNVTMVVTHHASKAGGFRGSTSIPAAFDVTVEFSRSDLDSDTQMRGLLTARGRDLPKVSQHIEFEPETFRWRASTAPPLAAQPTNIRDKIFAVVNSTDEWLTADELAERIPDTKLQTVRNALTGMMNDRYTQLLVRGAGTKGDPRRFHGIHRFPEIHTDDSGNDPGGMDSPSELVSHHQEADEHVYAGTKGQAWEDL